MEPILVEHSDFLWSELLKLEDISQEEGNEIRQDLVVLGVTSVTLAAVRRCLSGVASHEFGWSVNHHRKSDQGYIISYRHEDWDVQFVFHSQ